MNGEFERQGRGNKCESCGAWFSDDARGELHKPGCASPKIKARIDADRERLRSAEAGQRDEATLITCILRNLPHRREAIGEHLLGESFVQMREKLALAGNEYTKVQK